MNQRLILTGLVAGIAMYAWSSIAHMALPLGDAGVREMPNEQAVLGPLHTTLGAASGMYLFPGMGTGTSRQKMQTYERKLATSPNGILIYHPPGGAAMTARQLITELVAELIEAMLATLLLAAAGVRGFAARVGFVAVIGFVAALTTNVSYWNWYGFPVVYTQAYTTTQFVGFLVVGVVAAAMLKEAPVTQPAAYSAAA